MLWPRRGEQEALSHPFGRPQWPSPPLSSPLLPPPIHILATPFLPHTCIIDCIAHLIAIYGARLVCVVVFENFLAIENLRTEVTHSSSELVPSLVHFHFTSTLVLSSHLPRLNLLPEVMKLLQVQSPRAICLEEGGQGYRAHSKILLAWEQTFYGGCARDVLYRRALPRISTLALT